MDFSYFWGLIFTWLWQVTVSLNAVWMHVFTNASSIAYSSLVHLVHQEMQGIKSSLILAKSRIAPIKGITIPSRTDGRTHRNASSAIYHNITRLLQHKGNLMSDSKCALHWIKNHSNLLPRFVQNRIDEIRSYLLLYSKREPRRCGKKSVNPKQLRSFMPARGNQLATMEIQFWQ